MAIQPWKLLKSTFVFQHKWYQLRRDEVQLANGNILDDYFVSVRPDVVVAFPLTLEKEVIMVRQYKHGAGKVLLELPGGVIDEGETSAVDAVKRELLEETGYAPARTEHIITLHDNPTKDTNKIYGFLARDVEKVADQHLDPSEDIEIVSIPLHDIRKMIYAGEINVANSVAISLLVLDMLEQ